MEGKDYEYVYYEYGDESKAGDQTHSENIDYIEGSVTPSAKDDNTSITETPLGILKRPPNQ